MSTSPGDPTPKIYGSYLGRVVAVDDPEKLGRVRAMVPGVVEPMTGWAWPMGFPGAGGNRRGAFCPPPEGAAVLVLFVGGDVERPVYLCGHFGAPGGTVETPGPVGGYATTQANGSPGIPEDIPPDQAPKVAAIETEHFVVVVDDRDDKRLLRIEAKRTGDHLLIDAKNDNMDVSCTGTLTIRSTSAIMISAPKITLGDRVVVQNGRPLK